MKTDSLWVTPIGRRKLELKTQEVGFRLLNLKKFLKLLPHQKNPATTKVRRIHSMIKFNLILKNKKLTTLELKFFL